MVLTQGAVLRCVAFSPWQVISYTRNTQSFEAERTVLPCNAILLTLTKKEKKDKRKGKKINKYQLGWYKVSIQ